MKLTCSNCGWSQKFWYRENNPIRDLLDLEKELLEEDLDEIINSKKRPALPRRVSIAVAMQQASSHVLNMHWRTHKEWNDSGRPCCPVCDTELELL